jgi:hypothetical protein
MPVRESRDHRLFDSYPRLIAAFRALQSLLMPRHPPCALSSLTTRIERSQTSHESFESSIATLDFGSAWPGLCCQRTFQPATPRNQRYFLALRLGRTLQGRAETTRPVGILSRCQLPRPNCQRSLRVPGGRIRNRADFACSKATSTIGRRDPES